MFYFVFGWRSFSLLLFCVFCSIKVADSLAKQSDYLNIVVLIMRFCTEPKKGNRENEVDETIVKEIGEVVGSTEKN